jgi:carbon monoxide dehydrogenase subunit G
VSTVNAEIEIAAPIDAVWKTVMDPARLGDWVTIHKSLEEASRPPLHKGATMDQCLAIRGLTFRVHWNLVKVDEPRHAEWEGIGPARSRARTAYSLSEGKNGSTLFQYTNEFHPPGGRLGSMAGRMIVGATSEREAKKSLAQLKSLLEKHA